MMALQTFTFDAKAPIRTLLRGDEPWFVAADVCAALTIANARDAVAGLDEDERDGVGITDAIGREQETGVISESGLYTLILRSRKPQAKAFRRWVTHEVLPALRREGRYQIPAAPPRVTPGASVLPYQGFPVRVFRHQGQPWVSAKDFCLACGYSWHKGGSLVAHIPHEMKGLALLETLEGCSRQHVMALSLDGVQTFAARARYPEARQFHGWLRTLPAPTLPEIQVDPTVTRAPNRLGRPAKLPAIPPGHPVFLPTSEDRARFAVQALEHHESTADLRDIRYAYEHQMPHLLADLMHLAEREHLDFMAMLGQGRQHFIAERALPC